MSRCGTQQEIPAENFDRLVEARDVFTKGSEVHQALNHWVLAPVGNVADAVSKGTGIRS